jgi:hypothetical protein
MTTKVIDMIAELFASFEWLKGGYIYERCTI